MNTRKLALWGFVSVTLATSVVAILLSRRVDDVRAEIEATRAEIAARSAERKAELERANYKLRFLETEVARLQDELKPALEEMLPKNEYKVESVAGEFEAWVGRADALAKFLAVRQDLRIPEMEHLSATDWLDATKYDHFENEENLRKAAARLREIAKTAFSPKIREALLAYLKASGGELPESPDDILEFANGSISADILDRYEISETGEVPGIRFVGSRIVLVEVPVDDEWHTRMVYSDTGGVGRKGSRSLEPDG